MVSCSQVGRSSVPTGFFFGVEGGGDANGAATFLLGAGIDFGFCVGVEGAGLGEAGELFCNLASRFRRIFGHEVNSVFPDKDLFVRTRSSSSWGVSAGVAGSELITIVAVN